MNEEFAPEPQPAGLTGLMATIAAYAAAIVLGGVLFLEYLS